MGLLLNDKGTCRRAAAGRESGDSGTKPPHSRRLRSIDPLLTQFGKSLEAGDRARYQHWPPKLADSARRRGRERMPIRRVQAGAYMPVRTALGRRELKEDE